MAPRGATPRRALAVLAGALAFSAASGVAQAARVHELVSPVDNNGELNSLGFIAPDGESIAYTSTGTFRGAPQVGGPQGYAAHRDSAGWATTPLFTPGFPALHAVASGSTLTAFNSPLQLEPTDTDGNTDDLFLADGTNPIARISVGPLKTNGDNAVFAGASADLSHVFFENATPLTSDDTHTFGVGLYEYTAGAAANVSVPDAPSAARGVELGGGPGRRAGAVSADGTRVALTSPAAPTAQLRLAVWTRVAGQPAVRLTDSAPTADQRFDGAGADLAHVFISTTQQLVAGDTDALFDIYEVDTTTTPHTVSRVSSMGNATGCNVPNPAGTAFTKLNNCEARTVAVSSDGSSIAFVSGETAAGAASNVPHLYVRRGNALTDVAALSSVNDLVPPRGAQLSADGSTLVLATAAALVPADTDTAVDVYAFSTSTALLTLLSGAGSHDAVLSSSAPAYSLSSHLDAAPRNVTDDGGCVYFETPDGLVADDTNNKTDVYASCGGSPSLVSGGSGPDDSHFVGSSGDGQDVFFVTTDALSILDVDGGASLYDWRADGLVPTSPPAACDEDACQGGTTAQIERTPVPSNAGEGGPDAATGLFTLLAVRATAAKAARRGYFKVQANPPVPGTITATATARLKRKRVVIASVNRPVTSAASVTLRLVLSRAARRALRHRALPVDLEGRFVGEGIDTSDDDAVKLDRAPKPKKKKKGRAGR